MKLRYILLTTFALISSSNIMAAAMAGAGAGADTEAIPESISVPIATIREVYADMLDTRNSAQPSNIRDATVNGRAYQMCFRLRTAATSGSNFSEEAIAGPTLSEILATYGDSLVLTNMKRGSVMTIWAKDAQWGMERHHSKAVNPEGELYDAIGPVAVGSPDTWFGLILYDPELERILYERAHKRHG